MASKTSTMYMNTYVVAGTGEAKKATSAELAEHLMDQIAQDTFISGNKELFAGIDPEIIRDVVCDRQAAFIDDVAMYSNTIEPILERMSDEAFRFQKYRTAEQAYREALRIRDEAEKKVVEGAEAERRLCKRGADTVAELEKIKKKGEEAKVQLEREEKALKEKAEARDLALSEPKPNNPEQEDGKLQDDLAKQYRSSG